jgi:signal recognition particle GTPase
MYQDHRPPLNNTAKTTDLTKKLTEQPLSSTARSKANSKWSINIQEIVKRTQRNLERGTSNGPSSLTRTYEDKPSLSDIPPKLYDEAAGVNKATNLYRELKSKLSVDSSQSKSVSQTKQSVLRPQSSTSNSKNLIAKHLPKKESSRERSNYD